MHSINNAGVVATAQLCSEYTCEEEYTEPPNALDVMDIKDAEIQAGEKMRREGEMNTLFIICVPIMVGIYKSFWF